MKTCLRILLTGSLVLASLKSEAAVIHHTALFKGVTPTQLYDTYLDQTKHSAAIGAPAVIESKTGGRFQTFGGFIQGKLLDLQPGKFIVQTWRPKVFGPGDLDSILTLTFSATPEGAQIELVQVNVPESLAAFVENGWKETYWRNWESYFKTQMKKP